jgi:hypothetical protein
MQLVFRQTFARLVDKYGGNYRVRSFSCWHQFLYMSFGQLAQRGSLRGIVTCVNAHPEKLFHLGWAKGVKRSTLADANEERDYRIYEAPARGLPLGKADLAEAFIDGPCQALPCYGGIAVLPELVTAHHGWRKKVKVWAYRLPLATAKRYKPGGKAATSRPQGSAGAKSRR